MQNLKVFTSENNHLTLCYEQMTEITRGFPTFKSFMISAEMIGFKNLDPSYTHFLHGVLEGKKTTRSQFSVPGLREIHRKLKQEKKIQFSRVLFLKIPFLYFFLHKSWIWRTLGHVMNIFSYWHFHNASKEYFWSKKISNFMHGFKSAILAKKTSHL